MKFTLTVLTIYVCFGAETAKCQNHTKAMGPFRSELWQREFRQEEKKREDAPMSADGEPDNKRISRSDGLDNVEETAGIRDMELPGQAVLDDLRNETPIAEWNVDDIADTEYRSSGGAYRSEATAWQLSRSGADSTAPDATQMSEGPTMTTYLVGFMACIVVCGAMLTGRE